MKKSSLICLTIFSGFILISLILSIILVSHLYVNNGNIYDLSSISFLQPISLVFSLLSIIGTFVCSIIVCAKSGKLEKSKSLVRASSIVGIVASSVSFIFSVLVFVSPILTLIGCISIIVTFGLSIASYFAVNKHKEFMIDSNH